MAHLWITPCCRYGIEGLAALWRTDAKGRFLSSGAIGRLAELAEGPPLRPKKAESAILNQMLVRAPAPCACACPSTPTPTTLTPLPRPLPLPVPSPRTLAALRPTAC